MVRESRQQGSRKLSNSFGINNENADNSKLDQAAAQRGKAAGDEDPRLHPHKVRGPNHSTKAEDGHEKKMSHMVINDSNVSNDIRDAEKLAKGEIDALIAEYQQTQEEEVATELVLRYKPMVEMAARRMSRNRPDLYEDLFQVGQMSLLRSMQNYDLGKGFQFDAYAMTSLIGHMKNYLRDKSWYIQVPRRIKEKGAKIQQTIDKLTIEKGRSPSIQEIAAHLELTEEETIEILAGREYYHVASLDVPMGEEGQTADLKEIIADGSNDYQQLINRITLEQSFEKLDQMERQVLDMVFNKGMTQRKVAQVLNISQMSVSRTQNRAVEKIKVFFNRE